jgi:hypothetical protein
MELGTPCKKCGSCCKWLAFKTLGLSPEVIDWLRTRGANVDGDYLIIPHTCQHLTDKNLCDIHYAENYPILCRRFHGHGRFYIPKGCVYATPEAEENEKEILKRATESQTKGRRLKRTSMSKG